MLTEDEVRERLRGVVEEPELSRREDRWLAMTADVVAFVGDAARLEREAWLIERWRAAGVPTPRVLRDERELQVRERLHGRTGLEIHAESELSPLFEGRVPDVRARFDDAPLSSYGARVATSYGELAARIRRAVHPDEAIGFGPPSPRRTDVDAAIARLPDVVRARGERARDWLRDIPPPTALIHADLHFFNFCTDDTGAITGLFDFGDAGLDAPETELAYIDSLGAQFAATVLAAYGTHDADAVRRAHLRTVLDHVLSHGPGTPRHASITAWAIAAFERFA